MDYWTLFRRYLDFFYTCVTGYIYFQYSRRFQYKKPRENLTPLDDVVYISPNIVRVLGQNPGTFTLQGTNTYLVGSEKKKLLIDAGEANNMRYIGKLKESLGDATIEGIICTHWHHDHTGGCPSVRDHFRTSRGEKPPVYRRKYKTNKNLSECTYVEEGYVFKQDGITLRVIDTRGHTSDHISLFYEEEGVLFSGDCILGQGTSIFEDLSDYMRSLKKLLELPCKIICPGHGPVIIDAKAKIKEYIEKREKRERQILDYFRKVVRANPLEVTRGLYKTLPKNVHVAAFRSTQLHLKKLEDEGKLRKTGLVDYVYVHC
ncbi:metallo-beta-lactamase domain protein [Necator americanus]|uniref:Beta-lactamase-like protein 2 homolog n=1 Tax=Necator americanus TaxID=51031 RepID=W2TR01_NECAM|nr:metallo-beta-lactamase domain protein [Necator americanus]ETN83457.1 metallo-beta-lactamase domain protein [Necator americanus]